MEQQPWYNEEQRYIIPLSYGLQVLMKDIVTPVPPEEVKGVIRKCLEQAAQLNYQRIKEYAKIEGNQEHTAQHRTMTAGVTVLMSW